MDLEFPEQFIQRKCCHFVIENFCRQLPGVSDKFFMKHALFEEIPKYIFKFYYFPINNDSM
jgi:hypothetical protein